MPNLHRNYYGYHYEESKIPVGERIFLQGYGMIEEHPLFGELEGDIYMKGRYLQDKSSAAAVDRRGKIYVNPSLRLSGAEWAYVIAHCLLHLAFGHFDAERLPGDGSTIVTGVAMLKGNAFASGGRGTTLAGDGEFFVPEVWNKACDIYVARFLADIKFGRPICDDPAERFSIKLNDEVKIYQHLMYMQDTGKEQQYGTNSKRCMDMAGLDHPVVYKDREKNGYMAAFAYAMASSVTKTVSDVSGVNKEDTPVTRAAQWFLTHYPLLGGMAASFRIIEDFDFCYKNEIHIAAVNATDGEIYVNPAAGLSEEEWRFVLAHEYLHAGLQHHKRCQGRDAYLWNIACDYVINGWLVEMAIGEMCEGTLYDKDLSGLSAESIYDMIVKQMRKFVKHATFRGYHKGDIVSGTGSYFGRERKGIALDEFFKNALREGLDFHNTGMRGYLPAGLVEEIRALTMPPIPWEVELGRWFDEQFPPLEKRRSYARPSRRQGATPDIPRPRYLLQEQDLESRTFGVVIDTSGSVSARQIGMALGAIASYAVAKEVPFVRVVYCDADAYDGGYLSPEEIAGRVKVTGRGGTVLQPAVSLLEGLRDFPADGPILIITDGYIESRLRIRREHAYLLPKGNHLPFMAKGKVFYFQE